MIKFRDELICGDLFLHLSLIHTCFLLQQYGKCWPAARNKSDYEALANLAKISCRQVKVDLHIRYLFHPRVKIIHMYFLLTVLYDINAIENDLY